MCLDMNTIALPPQGIAVQPEQSYVADHNGFETMYIREYPGLHAFAAALTGYEQGEDLVQDTMFKAFVNWNRVGRLDRPGGWCHRVLINLCRSFWRRRRIEDRFQRRFPTRPGTTDGPTPDIVAFWDAVRVLPSRPRLAVALYYAADCSTIEIASLLDVPEGTVRSDLARARLVLAEQLRG